MAQVIAVPTIRFPLWHGVSRLTATLRLWRQRLAEKDQIAAFDARELHDIGWTDVDRVQFMHRPFWRG